jgi:ribulose-phosphate 3-epimerase
MTQIIPAILPQNFEEIEDKASRVASYTSVVQVDICDGKYVPSQTWPYTKGSEASFLAVLDEQMGMPHWDTLDYEFDLMVKDPEKVFEQYVSLGASRIVIHMESLSHDSLLRLLNTYGKKGGYMSMFDVEIGLAIRVDTNIEPLAETLAHFNFVQVMGINRVGFQGESFDTRAVALVKALRQAYPQLMISVDGGVNLDTAPALVDAGADRLVVGSAIFKTDDVAGTLGLFESI